MILLLGLITPINAAIDINYPNNNTTTEIWFATDSNSDYMFITNNTIPDATYNHVIIRNKVTDPINPIENPIIIIDEFNKMFYILVILFALIFIIYSVKKVIK